VGRRELKEAQAKFPTTWAYFAKVLRPKLLREMGKGKRFGCSTSSSKGRVERWLAQLEADKRKRLEWAVDRRFLLLTEKLFFPYDSIKNLASFQKGIPRREVIFNTLTQSRCSSEEYASLRKICRAFHIKTLGELHDLYVNVDVTLLADVWEKFR